MKTGFYPKLAWSGMRRNSRLYTPYMLTCVGMAAMYYIVSFIAESDVIRAMRGGENVAMIMTLGKLVVAVFAAIFLFYTNSFLIRRRKKEFGLYNVLGMGKSNLARILAWECLMTAAGALAVGLVCGAALSKLAELCLVNIIRGDVSFSFSVSPGSMVSAAVIFSVIFLAIFLNGLRQVHVSSPAELLRSENSGEKPPKANRAAGVIGCVILAAAYYLAVSIKKPLAAMMWFFAAVILVIIATYVLFVSGSVAMCRALQRNSRYYYRADHFVSVSSMAFRMKRNGAGLASICILATMVLVMISSTTCLYFGTEDALDRRYPRDVQARITLGDIDGLTDGTVELIRDELIETARETDPDITNVLSVKQCTLSGIIVDGALRYDLTEFVLFDPDDVVTVYFMPLEDYNAAAETPATLEGGEILAYPLRTDYSCDSFAVGDGERYRVKDILEEIPGSAEASADLTASIFVVTDDLRGILNEALDTYYGTEDICVVTSRWELGFDSSLDTDGQTALQERLFNKMAELAQSGEFTSRYGAYSYACESRAAESADFYGSYGGLFFLGILLSVVFLAAAVLMIYYKQISEGYEDRARFDIMRKVGMTKKDIRKSIDSQLLTVFFLPLGAAGLHLAFSFPMLSKLLQLFNLVDTGALILTTVLSFLVFAVFYTVVYRVTSGAYFAIVSGEREARI